MVHYRNLSLENIECEIWKDIKDYEGLYQVSNMGRLKRLKRKIVTINNITKTVKEKILFQRINKKGYLVITLNKSKNGLVRTRSVHQLVGIAFIPNPENKITINHINGNKTDNKVSSIEWATQKENIEHAWRTGLSKSQKRNYKKLTITQIKKIMKELKPSPKIKEEI
jgi:hypothetical protein